MNDNELFNKNTANNSSNFDIYINVLIPFKRPKKPRKPYLRHIKAHNAVWVFYHERENKLKKQYPDKDIIKYGMQRMIIN